MSEAPRANGPVLEAMVQLLLRLMPKVEKLPKSQRFRLGERIQSTARDVLDSLIVATFTHTRAAGSSRSTGGKARCGGEH